MGFSAGGHLASTVATHLNAGQLVDDEISQLSYRPNFQILIYPVISMKEGVTHGGSRKNLLGNTPSEDMINFYSNELQVTDLTPPTFLVHATDDKAVSVRNSLLFYQALLDLQVSAELHVYPYGNHGFGLAVGQGYIATWIEGLGDWLIYIKDE